MSNRLSPDSMPLMEKGRCQCTYVLDFIPEKTGASLSRTPRAPSSSKQASKEKHLSLSRGRQLMRHGALKPSQPPPCQKARDSHFRSHRFLRMDSQAVWRQDRQPTGAGYGYQVTAQRNTDLQVREIGSQRIILLESTETEGLGRDRAHCNWYALTKRQRRNDVGTAAFTKTDQ